MSNFTLTIKQKILLQLFRFDGRDLDNKFDMPFGLTQEGIANALGISRAHACVELHHLGDRLIDKTQGHVTNAPNTRTVYFLTSDGRREAQKLHDKAKANSFDIGSIFIERPYVKAGNRNATTRMVKDKLQEAIDYINEFERLSAKGECKEGLYRIFLTLQEAEKLIAYSEFEERRSRAQT